MTAEDRVALIEDRLREHLAVAELEVHDESHLHRGHPGAAAGGGHYALRVVSDDFAGRTRLQRQRLVYAALGEALAPDRIHALRFIATLTRAEAEAT